MVHETTGRVIVGIINEVEAYTQEDPACHTFGGKQTKRNSPMFGEPGTLYIYFIYGMYFCLNIVTEEKGRGCAVLLRGCVPMLGMDVMRRNRFGKADKYLCNGPAKLVQAFGVSPTLNGCVMADSPLYVSEDKQEPKTILKLPRVGISKGVDLLWRFVGEF